MTDYDFSGLDVAPAATSAPGATQPEQKYDFSGLDQPNVESQPQYDFSDLEPEVGKYDSTGQKILTGIEGYAKGVISAPITTGIEAGLNKLGVPSMAPEDISGREEAHPWISHGSEAAGIATGLYTGVGELGLISKGLEGVEGLRTLEAGSIYGKVGAGAIKGAIENGILQGGDELSNAMLGKGDPNTPVSSALAHIGGAALLGGTFGGMAGAASSGLKAVEDARIGSKAEDFLAGIGTAASGQRGVPIQFQSPAVKNLTMFNAGQDFYQKGLQSIIGSGAEIATSSLAGLGAAHLTGPVGGLATYGAVHKVLGPTVEKITGKLLTPIAKKTVLPAVMKALSAGDAVGIPRLMDWATTVSRGSKAVQSAVDTIFDSSKIASQQAISAAVMDNNREKLRNMIDDGELDKQIQAELKPAQGFAEGGSVQTNNNPAKPVLQGTDAIATHYPEQAMMLGAAKSRIYNYLSQIKPQDNLPRLPFDEPPSNTEKKRSYDKALDIANQPLSILEKVRDGRLTNEDMQHFSSMYPELHDHLKKKITEKITDYQLNKDDTDRPKSLFSLSMFMGTPMTSLHTPQSIQMIQSVFTNQKIQQQAQMGQTDKPKKNTSKLGKVSQEYQTADQAAETRAKQ